MAKKIEGQNCIREIVSVERVAMFPGSVRVTVRLQANEVTKLNISNRNVRKLIDALSAEFA